MLVTAAQIIRRAGGLLNAFGEGTEPSGTQALDGLTMLRQMLDTWAAAQISTPARTRETFALTGAASYTMGPMGDFDTAAPTAILEATINDGAGNDWALTIGASEDYAAVTVKATVGRPVSIYIDKGWPLWTLRFDLVPYDPTLKITSLKPYAPWAASTAAELNTPVDVPPGWTEAMMYGLAVRMADEYNLPLPPMVLQLAVQNQRTIQNAAFRAPELRIPTAALGSAGYWSGRYSVRGGP